MNKIVSEYMFDVATGIVETSFDNEREDAYVCVEDISNDITIKRCILNKNTKKYSIWINKKIGNKFLFRNNIL